MITTAEGIENLEQLARIQSTGCAQVQGFLFSKALPASQLFHGGEKRLAKLPHDAAAKLTDKSPVDLTSKKAKPQRKTG